MILGPLFAREVPAVVAAAGGRPVLSFSNDVSLVESGAFLLGITPAQGVVAVLSYARRQGVRRVVVMSGTDDWSRRSVASARQTAAAVGLELFVLEAAQPQAPGTDVIAAVRAASGGTLPDAVLMTQADPSVAGIDAALSQAEVQILGPSIWSGTDAALLGAAEGAWVAAPDPAAFATFAQTYEQTHGIAPDIAAGLAFDAANIFRRLRLADAVSREGMLSPSGFPGALGMVRFAPNGSCMRQMAILVAQGGAFRVVRP